MRKKGLAAVCVLIALVLSGFMMISVFAEEIQMENQPDQGIRRVIILPYTNMNGLYSQADPANRILDTVTGLLQMLPDDGSVMYSIRPVQGNNIIESADPKEVIGAMDLNAGSGDPGQQIKAIKPLLENASAGSVLLVLDCSSANRDGWRQLGDIADGGTNVVFVEIGNSSNAGNYNKFIDFFNVTEDAKNRIAATEREKLRFCWIEDADTPLDVLLPLFEEQTGKKYTKAAPEADGSFLLVPFATLTERTELLIQWSQGATDEMATMIPADTDTLQAEGASQMDSPVENSTFSQKIVGKGAGRITVSSADAVYYDLTEASAEGISLKIRVGNDKEFHRNEQNSYEISLDASGLFDAAAFEKDLEAHNLAIRLRKEGDESFSQPADWNEEQRKWRTDIAYATSGEWKVYAEADLGNGRIIRSEAYSVNVTNRPPTLSLGQDTEAGTEKDPVRCWINDPWNSETMTSVSIPIVVADDDGDKVTLTVNGENATLVTGLGTARISEDQTQIIITLNKTGDKLDVNTGEQFALEVEGADGEQDAVPLPVTLELQDLTAELGKVKAFPLIVEDSIAKNTEFRVSFSIDLAACEEPERISGILAKNAGYQAAWENGKPIQMVFNPEDHTYSVEMNAGDKGEKNLTVSATAEAVPKPDSKLITVTGSAPKIKTKDAELPEDQEGMLEKAGETLRWTMEKQLSGAELFTDDDKDTFTVGVTVTREESDPAPGTDMDGVGFELVVPDADEPLPETGKIAAGTRFALRILEEGDFLVQMTAKDDDGESEPVSFHVSLQTLETRLLQAGKKYGPFAGAGLLLLLVLAYLLKPSFKGKVLRVETVTEDVEQIADIPLDSWGKSKKPFSQVLTCAAFPPEPEVYEKISGVRISPSRKGIWLRNAGNLTGGQKKVKVDANHPLNCRIDGINMSINVKKTEEV